jgi:hypothetical protein
MRSQISDRVLDYKYEKNSVISEVSKEIASLASEAYNNLFTERQRVLIDSLPNRWMLESDTIGVKFGWEVAQLNFNGDPSNFCSGWDNRKLVSKYFKDSKEVKKRILSGIDSGFRYNNIVDIVFPVDHDLTTRFNKISRRIEDFLDEYKKDRLSINVTLNSFITAKKLMDEWPEIKPFVLQVIGRTSSPVQSTALAISRSELNEKFGLPIPA